MFHLVILFTMNVENYWFES